MTTPKKMSEDKRPCLDPICARPLLMQKIAAQAEEIEALKAWKAEALAVEATWDVQSIGKVLNLPLGTNIRAAILPAIEALKAEAGKVRNSALEEAASHIESEPCEPVWGEDRNLRVAKKTVEECAAAIRALKET